MVRIWFNQITKWDTNGFYLISNSYYRHNIMRNVFYTLSKSGDGYLYALTALLILLLAPVWSWTFLKITIFAFIIELPMYQILKKSIRRDRPFSKLNDVIPIVNPSDKFSFPSGHTASAFLMSTILGFFIPPLQFFLFVWATGVGYSRVYRWGPLPNGYRCGNRIGNRVGFPWIFDFWVNHEYFIRGAGNRKWPYHPLSLDGQRITQIG